LVLGEDHHGVTDEGKTTHYGTGRSPLPTGKQEGQTEDSLRVYPPDGLPPQVRDPPTGYLV